MWKLLGSFDTLKDFASQTGLSLRSGLIVLAFQHRLSEWQLMVIVSLPNQALHTGRDPELEVENTCSTRKKWNVFLTLKILLILSINFSYSRIIKDVNSVFKKMPNTEYLVWSGFEAFLAFSRLSGNPEESKRDAFWRQTFIKNLYWLITTAMKRCSYLTSPTRSLFIVTDQLHFTFLCSYS